MLATVAPRQPQWQLCARAPDAFLTMKVDAMTDQSAHEDSDNTRAIARLCPPIRAVVPRHATIGAAAVSAFPCPEALERWEYLKVPASMRQTRLRGQRRFPQKILPQRRETLRVHSIQKRAFLQLRTAGGNLEQWSTNCKKHKGNEHGGQHAKDGMRGEA
jgi:hypothetical protein